MKTPNFIPELARFLTGWGAPQPAAGEQPPGWLLKGACGALQPIQ